jgi:hypothetical protein
MCRMGEWPPYIVQREKQAEHSARGILGFLLFPWMLPKHAGPGNNQQKFPLRRSGRTIKILFPFWRSPFSFYDPAPVSPGFSLFNWFFF